MNRDDSVDEKFVSHVWGRGHFTKDNLRAKDGRRIELISRGQRNDDSGADFRNAEIRIGGQLQKGDVEIHVKNSHWRAHRHDANPNYNDTILHVVMWDDCIGLLTRKQNGERIPTLILCDHLDRPIGMIWKTLENHEEEPPPCCNIAESMSLEGIGKILDDAGIERFHHRVKIIEQKLKENSLERVRDNYIEIIKKGDVKWIIK